MGSDKTALAQVSASGVGLVSCRFLDFLTEVSDRHNFDIDDILQGVTYSLDHLQKRTNFIDWDSFRRILTNLSARLSPAEMQETGRKSFTSRSRIAGVFPVIGRTLLNVQPLYRWLALDIVPNAYPVTSSLVSQGSLKLHLRMLVNEPLQHCPELFQIIEGQFIGMSTSMGYEECEVETILLDRGAEYVVKFPQRRTLSGSLWTLLRKPFDLNLISIELKNAQEDLIEKSLDLEFEAARFREAQNKISDLERQHRLLEDTLPDLVWICDRNGHFTYVSPAIKLLYGYEVEEVLQRDSGMLLTQSDLPGMEEAFGRERGIEEVDDTQVFEVISVHKDGSEFWSEIRMALFFDNQGDMEGFAGVTRDISQRKKAEYEKRLLEKELAYSRHMESIGQLAGGIAHDFNNMLTTVMGFADLARDSVEGDHKLQSYLAEISRAGSKASDLVKQLLTFSKQKPMEPIPLDVNELVRQLGPMLKRLVSENIDLSIDLQSVPKILGDTTELERVIVNLCINANDAMHDGGRLSISTRKYLLGGDDSRSEKAGTNQFVCLSVSDTGHGIDPEIQEKVLEPFFTTKPFGEGTGLGLAVTYSIVQQHNGFLDIVSHPNRGTTIKVFLPETHQKTVTHTAPGVSPRKNHSGTILVVEDHEQVRHLMVEILETGGYEVIESSHGLEAVEIFEKNWQKIDLVVMDIVMPKMGGRDAMARMIKSDPDVKVLFMTGYSQKDPRTDFALKHGNSILRKPFTSSDVIRSVSELIGD